MPQQHRSLFYALAFEGRKQHGLSAADLQSRNRQGFLGLSAGQFVGFGQQHQQLQSFFDARADDFQQDVVQFGQTQTGIGQHDHGIQVAASSQIAGHDPLPAQFGLFGDGSVAITRQIGEYRIGAALFADGKQVDALGASGGFGRKGQPFLLGQGVDGGGFASVGAADKGDFWLVDARQVFQLGGSG